MEMLFKGFSILNSSDHFVQQSRTILAMEEHFCAKYFEMEPLAKDEMSFEDFLFLALVAILFNGAEQLLLWSSWISNQYNFS